MTIGLVGPHKSHLRRPKVMLIDLDDTLYRAHEIPTIVRERIQEFMVKKLGIPQDKVAALTLELYQKYGTTLAGLVASGYKIDYDEWHEFVHQGALDYSKLLHPDPSLRDILCSIDMPKYILTNANREHMELCLQRLGISDCFQGEYYFENVMALAASHGFDTAHAVLCKPMPRIYTLVAEQLGVSLSEVLFFDDSVRNLAAAHALGAFTVLVGADAAPPGAAGIDLALPTMHKLPAAMPQLLDQPGLVHDEPHVHLQHGHGHGVQAEREMERERQMAMAGAAEASAIPVPS